MPDVGERLSSCSVDDPLRYLHGSSHAYQKGACYMRQFIAHRPRWQMALAFLVLAFALALVPVLTVFTGVHAAGANRSTKPTFAHFKGLTYALAQSQNGSQPPPPPTDQQCRKQIGVPC